MMIDGEFWTGLAVAVAANLSYVAGGGIALARREKHSSLFGVISVGLTLLGLSVFWISRTSWSLNIFNVSVSGIFWCCMGFFVGFAFDLTGPKKSSSSKGAAIKGRNTLEDPIIIPPRPVSNPQDYVRAQYEFINHIHTSASEEWMLNGQYLLSPNGRYIDKMIVDVKSIGSKEWDRKVEYYFDVTDKLKNMYNKS